MISQSILHQINPRQKLDLEVYLEQLLPIESVTKKKQKHNKRARLDIKMAEILQYLVCKRTIMPSHQLKF